MIVFLDTEFTNLVLTPRLLSVGLVERGGLRREFYAEVTDLHRLAAASRFTLVTVMPQFGRVPDASCTYRELAARVAGFLGGLVDTLAAGEVLHLAFCSEIDWQLLRLALQEADLGAWPLERILQAVVPVNIFELTGQDLAREVAETYLAAQAEAPIARHHALCDARALGLAFEAVRGQAVPLLGEAAA